MTCLASCGDAISRPTSREMRTIFSTSWALLGGVLAGREERVVFHADADVPA